MLITINRHALRDFRVSEQHSKREITVNCDDYDGSWRVWLNGIEVGHFERMTDGPNPMDAAFGFAIGLHMGVHHDHCRNCGAEIACDEHHEPLEPYCAACDYTTRGLSG